MPLWAPQPGPQTDAITASWCPELFYGGAAGGGKSDFLLGDYLQDVPTYGSAWRGILFRRTYPELEELIARSKEMYLQTEARWNDQNKTWRWANGATLKMRYAERNDDVLRYQGHQYCVGVGTPIVMSDGSLRAIETIRVGDIVRTLAGPRRVTATVKPYLAPCVKASVFDASGDFVGGQVQPIWHPVLSESGVDWFSYLGDDQTFGTEPSRRHQDSRRPLALSFPVTLHAPTLLSAARRGYTWKRIPISLRAFCKSTKRSLASTERKKAFCRDFSRRLGRFLRVLDHCGLWRANGFVCAPGGMRISPSSRPDCPTDIRFCDEHARVELGNVQGAAPSLSDAAKRPHALQKDETGTTPTRSHRAQRQWVHPYTGEVRDLSEEVSVGRVDLQPCGESWVCDLTVDDANHYISSCGLVNKNTWIGWDELTQWATLFCYRYLRSRLRSAHDVPTKRIRSCANPGGPGHLEVKQYFVDPAPAGYEPILDPDTGIERMYIPARLKDNALLNINDPTYMQRLKGLGSASLVKALLEGDWSIIDGAFFDCWSEQRHVIRPFEIPKLWMRFRSMDWGSASPFSVGWWAVVSDDTIVENSQGEPITLPRGCLVRYREWYGADKEHKGLKLTAEEVGHGIVSRETHREMVDGKAQDVRETISYGVIDPSAFKEDGGPSIAERIAQCRVLFRPADNTRVGTRGAMGGWDQLRSRLKGDEDGNPMLVVFSTCSDTIRTLPVLQHDPDRPEDVNTASEDHAPDEIRYACMSRPWASVEKKKPSGKIETRLPTLNEIVKEHTNRRKFIGNRI